ncbi:MAG: peptidoglycan-binding domain-containing protein [Patescibacteria group bacterium]
MKKVLLYSFSFILIAAAHTTWAAPLCVDISTNLAYKSANSSVTTLQGFLQTNKYLTTNPTGFYGTATVAAVKKFQSANGINSTGMVDANTRAHIQSLSCTADAAFKVQSAVNFRITTPLQ